MVTNAEVKKNKEKKKRYSSHMIISLTKSHERDRVSSRPHLTVVAIGSLRFSGTRTHRPNYKVLVDYKVCYNVDYKVSYPFCFSFSRRS